MGSDESHFNVSLIVRDKVTRPCPQTTTFEQKGEPKRYESNGRGPSASVPAYRLTARPNRLSGTWSSGLGICSQWPRVLTPESQKFSTAEHGHHALRWMTITYNGFAPAGQEIFRVKRWCADRLQKSSGWDYKRPRFHMWIRMHWKYHI